MVDARTTPRMTQQMMIMIFFCRGGKETQEGQLCATGCSPEVGGRLTTRYLAGLALVFDGLLGVGDGSLHVVDGVFNVVLNSVDHLALKTHRKVSHVSLEHAVTHSESGGAVTHLALHQHRHVDEHVVQLADAVFQLDDLGVSGLDLVQSLLGHLRVHLDLQERTGSTPRLVSLQLKEETERKSS